MQKDKLKLLWEMGDDVVHPLRTLESDIAELTKKGKTSLTDIAVAEEKRKAEILQKKKVVLPVKTNIQKIPVTNIDSGVKISREDVLSQSENELFLEKIRQEKAKSEKIEEKKSEEIPLPILPSTPPSSPRFEQLIPKKKKKEEKKQKESVEKISFGIGNKEESQVKKRLAMTVLAVLVLASVGIGGFYALKKIKEVSPPDQEVLNIIPLDEIKKIKLNDLENEVKNLRQDVSLSLRFTGFTFLKGEALIASSSAFLSEMAPSAPAPFVRILENDFLYGLIGLEGKIPEPFLILKVAQYDLAFGRLLDLEPNMRKVFLNLFPSNLNENAKIFKDRIITDKDTRSFINEDGKIVFIYGFPDHKTLLIAESREAFMAITERYLASY